MDPFTEDFDAFFNRMSGSSSGNLGTSAKAIRPPVVPSSKGKLPNSSFGSSRGTPATCKRKLGSLFTVSGDLTEGELDPVANKKISHMTNCFLYTSECIYVDMAAEVDRLDLNERYGRALKACHDVSAFHSFPPYFSFSSLFLFVFDVLLFFSFFFVGGLLPQPQSLRL